MLKFFVHTRQKVSEPREYGTKVLIAHGRLESNKSPQSFAKNNRLETIEFKKTCKTIIIIFRLKVFCKTVITSLVLEKLFMVMYFICFFS